MNTAVAMFRGPKNELGKPGQLETLRIQLATTTSWHLGEEPTQVQPHIQQEETQSNQYEAIGWVLGGGPVPYLSSAPIAGLDTKAATIQSLSLTRRQLNIDQDQPISFSFHASSTFGCAKHSTDRQHGCKGPS